MGGESEAVIQIIEVNFQYLVYITLRKVSIRSNTYPFFHWSINLWPSIMNDLDHFIWSFRTNHKPLTESQSFWNCSRPLSVKTFLYIPQKTFDGMVTTSVPARAHCST